MFDWLSFNPSVEGKPLQLHNTGCFLDMVDDVSIPLSRGSLCNYDVAESQVESKEPFQSLCRGEASATEPL